MFPLECKKHFGKFQIAMLLLLFIGNLLIPAVTYSDYFTEMYREIQTKKGELLELYFTSPDQYEAILEEHTEKKEQYDHERTVSIMINDGRGTVEFPNRYLFYPEYGDIALFQDVEKIIHAPDTYRDAVADVMRDAALRIKAIENRDTYAYRYYTQLILAYDPFFEATLPISNVTGWNEFFSLKTPLVFTLMASVVMFSGIFPIEHKTGMHGLLAVSKKGRKPLALVKCGTVLIGSTCITAVFTLSPMLIFTLSSGFSDAAAPVQLLDGFTYCFFEWSIGETLFYLTAFRVLFFSTFSVIAAVIGQYWRGEFPSVLFTAIGIFIGISMERILPDSPLYFLQKFSPTLLANGLILFTKYRGIQLFHHCLSYTPFVIVCIILLLFFAFSASLLQKYPIRLPKAKEKRSSSFRGCSLSLYGTELYKMMIGRRGGVFLLSALALRGIWSWAYFTPDTSMKETFYKDYMMELEGEITEEKLAYISAEGEEMEQILSSYAEMNGKHNKSLISEEEYEAYQSRYRTATYSEDAYAKLCQRRDDLISAHKLHERVEFMYEEGISRYFNRPYDVVSVLIILFFAYPLFPCEHDANIASVMECTKNGRHKLTKIKCFCVMTVALFLFLSTTAMDLIFMTYHYDLPNLHAAIQSIPLFQSVKWEISIVQYLIFYQVVALFGYAVCWLTSVFMSASVKTSRKSLPLLIFVLFLPYFIAVIGEDVFAWVNFANITSPTQISESIPPLLCLSGFGGWFLWKNKRYFKQ